MYTYGNNWNNKESEEDLIERNEQRKMEEEAVAKEGKKLVRMLSFVGIFFVVLIIFTSTMVITKPDEYKVIRQFGSIVRIEEEAGVSFKIPIIQSVTKVSNQILYYDLARSDVITSDKKTMIVDSYVLWRVTNPEKYMKTLSGSNKNAEGRLNTVIYNAIKNTISGMTQDEVIRARDGKINVSDVDVEDATNNLVVEDSSKNIQIKSLTEEITSNLADCSDYGIEIVKTEVKVLDLPDENKSAVYQRMVSERSNVAASYEAQGKSEAQMITNTTNKEISIMMAEAEATAAKLVAEGEAEYMKILSDAYNDQEKSDFYSFVRSLDAAKASIKEGTIILESDSPVAKIFYNK